MKFAQAQIVETEPAVPPAGFGYGVSMPPQVVPIADFENYDDAVEALTAVQQIGGVRQQLYGVQQQLEEEEQKTAYLQSELDRIKKEILPQLNSLAKNLQDNSSTASFAPTASGVATQLQTLLGSP